MNIKVESYHIRPVRIDGDKDEFEHGWGTQTQCCHYCYYCNEVDDLSFDGFGWLLGWHDNDAGNKHLEETLVENVETPLEPLIMVVACEGELHFPESVHLMSTKSPKISFKKEMSPKRKKFSIF